MRQQREGRSVANCRAGLGGVAPEALSARSPSRWCCSLGPPPRTPCRRSSIRSSQGHETERCATELAGNLGNDPETRIAASGTTVTTASIAVHTSYKQGDDWKERNDWFRLVAFGEASDYLASYCKGERIAVAGRLQSSIYIDRDGQKRTSVELVVLHSEPAPLPCKGDAVIETADDAPAAEEPLAEPEPRPRSPTRRPRSPADAVRSPPNHRPHERDVLLGAPPSCAARRRTKEKWWRYVPDTKLTATVPPHTRLP
ncbi:MAG: hypothetical protein OHK0015_28060 [Chloroflexi bacterium OHK40]